MSRPRLCLLLALALPLLLLLQPTVQGLIGYALVALLRERTLFAVSGALTWIGAKTPRNAGTFCRRVKPLQEYGAHSHDLEHVHVVYASNADGFPGLLTSLLSLSRHLADPAGCTLHVISPAEDHPRLRQLLGCFQSELRGLEGNRTVPEVVVHAAKAHASFNASGMACDVWMEQRPWLQQVWTWERIYLHEYFPQFRRVVWLDIDTIVQSDIAPLYRMKMEHPVAGGYEPPTVYKECFRRYPEAPQNYSWYFNAGVLVIDLDKWRSEGWAAEVERAAALTGGCYLDQLAMNLAMRGRFDLLPWSWNVAGLGVPPLLITAQPCCEHADILHFSGQVKPWMRRTSRWADHLVRPYGPRTTCAALSDDLSELYRPD